MLWCNFSKGCGSRPFFLTRDYFLPFSLTTAALVSTHPPLATHRVKAMLQLAVAVSFPTLLQPLLQQPTNPLRWAHLLSFIVVIPPVCLCLKYHSHRTHGQLISSAVVTGRAAPLEPQRRPTVLPLEATAYAIYILQNVYTDHNGINGRIQCCNNNIQSPVRFRLRLSGFYIPVVPRFRRRLGLATTLPALQNTSSI